MHPTTLEDSSTAFWAGSCGRRLRSVATEDSLSRAEELLAKLEAARGERDQLAQSEGGSPERALEILGELSELAKAAGEGRGRARRAAGAEPADSTGPARPRHA